MKGPLHPQAQLSSMPTCASICLCSPLARCSLPHSNPGPCSDEHYRLICTVPDSGLHPRELLKKYCNFIAVSGLQHNETMVQRFLLSRCPHANTASPIISVTHQKGLFFFFFTKDETILTHNHSKSIVDLKVCLDKSVICSSSSYHNEHFHCPRILCALPMSLSSPYTLANH